MRQESLLQIIGVLLPVLVPYVTAAIKLGMGKVRKTYPLWFKPLRPLVAGFLIAGLSKALGVPLPTDLMQITDSDVMRIITSGAMIGMSGSWLNVFTDKLKESFSREEMIGFIARLLSENPAKVVAPVEPGQ